MCQRVYRCVISILSILIAVNGLVSFTLHRSIECTTSIPFTTLPNTVCLLSNHGHGTVVMNHYYHHYHITYRSTYTMKDIINDDRVSGVTCEPLVLAPALAIDNTPARS